MLILVNQELEIKEKRSLHDQVKAKQSKQRESLSRFREDRQS